MGGLAEGHPICKCLVRGYANQWSSEAQFCNLTLRDGPIDLPGLVARPLTENRILLCASPDYLQRNPLPVLPETFAQHDWMIFRHPSISRVYWWLTLDNQRLRIPQPSPRLASDNYDLLLACVLDGQGLQFCPQWSVAPYLVRGELVQLLPEYQPEPDVFGPWVYVLYLAHRRSTRKVKALIEYLENHLHSRGIV